MDYRLKKLESPHIGPGIMIAIFFVIPLETFCNYHLLDRNSFLY